MNMAIYVHTIIYVLSTKHCIPKIGELKLGPNLIALVIFDNFKAQRTEKLLKLLKDNRVAVLNH